MSYTFLATAIGAVIIFYRAAGMENRSPWAWIALSIAAWRTWREDASKDSAQD